MKKAGLSSIMVAVALVVVGVIAEAQQAKKVRRIGVLLSGSGRSVDLEVLRQSLRELGYIEGQNIIIEPRWAEGKADRFPELAAELVRQKLDVIVTSGTGPTRALKDATTTIPIVVIGAGDLVGRGLIASLARPGGNITGSTSIAPDLSGKRLELLKEVVPQASRVAFLYQPYEEDELKETQIAAEALGVKIQRLEVQQPNQFQSAYAAMIKERADALLISRNPLNNFHRRQLIDLAAKNRLPATCDGMDWMNDGCLMSYGRDGTEGLRHAATYVDKILKGPSRPTYPCSSPRSSSS